MHLLEADKPLSQSLLWQMQRRYFLRSGVQAWQDDIVPSDISANPFMARAYSQMVLAYLRDCWQAGEIDPAAPVYIVELGAGAGRLGYHFLQQFHRRLAQTPLADLTVRYVMTDFVPQTVAFWQQHPRLRSWVDGGLLDFALFDVAEMQPPTLTQSAITLTAKTLANPLILIANYFFDSIPQDSFVIADRQMNANLLTLFSDQPQPDLDDPALWDGLHLAYEAIPLQRPYYPHQPLYDAILDDYAAVLPDTTLTFPNVGLDCLRFWQTLSGDRVLLLSSDRGITLLESLVGQDDPLPNLHGSFSLMVNYHAIAEWVTRSGGLALHAPHYQDSLQVVAYLLGASPADAPQTVQAFQDALVDGGPDDFFALKQALTARAEALTLPQVLGLLRWSAWDAAVFGDCYARLRTLVAECDPVWYGDVAAALHQIWQQYLPLRQPDPLRPQIADLLTMMGYDAEQILAEDG